MLSKITTHVTPNSSTLVQRHACTAMPAIVTIQSERTMLPIAADDGEQVQMLLGGTDTFV